MWLDREPKQPEKIPNRHSVSASTLLEHIYSHQTKPITRKEVLCYLKYLPSPITLEEHENRELGTTQHIAVEAYNFWMEVMPLAGHQGSRDRVAMRSLQEMMKLVNVDELRKEVFAQACAADPSTVNPLERYWNGAGHALTELGQMVAEGADVLFSSTGEKIENPQTIDEARDSFGNSLMRPYATSFGKIKGQVWTGLLTNDAGLGRLGNIRGMRQTGLGGFLVVTEKKKELQRQLTEKVRDDPNLSAAFYASYVYIKQMEHINKVRKNAPDLSEKMGPFMESMVKPLNEVVQRHGMRLLQAHLRTTDTRALLLEDLYRAIPDVVITAGKDGFVYLSGSFHIKGEPKPVGFKIGIKNGMYHGFEYLPGSYHVPSREKHAEVDATIKNIGYSFIKRIGVTDGDGYRKMLNDPRPHANVEKTLKSLQQQRCDITNMGEFFNLAGYEVTELRK